MNIGEEVKDVLSKLEQWYQVNAGIDQLKSAEIFRLLVQGHYEKGRRLVNKRELGQTTEVLQPFKADACASRVCE